MKKLLIFIFILIAAVACNNANKTGSSYNNSSNDNTEQGSNEEGNNSNTEQGGTSATDNNKEWLDKTANQKISKMKYYFDSNGNIINNGDGNKIYFLDGKQPQNCTDAYAQKISSFVAKNNDEPNWSNFPHMTENDINTTIDIKDKRWTDWGYFGSNIVG